MTLAKKSTNNGQRRRAVKAAKPYGVKVAYNENAPRSVIRKILNTYTKCPKCGDRMLVKNQDEHLRKALLHVEPKATKKRKEPNDG